MYMCDINVVDRAVVDGRQMKRVERKLGVKTSNIYNAYGVVAYKRECEREWMKGSVKG